VATNVLRGAVSMKSCPSGTTAENDDYLPAPCIGWVLAEPAAKEALGSGGIVATHRIHADGAGKAAVLSIDYAAGSSRSNGFYAATGAGSQPAGPTYPRPDFVPLSTKVLPAVVDAPDKPLHFYGVVSPETAGAMGMPVDDRALPVTTSGPLRLALADGRSDHATPAGIGADTRLRKAPAASQILMTALLGTVLGIVSGAIPVIVVLSLQRGYPMVLPRPHMAALVVLVPLFGAAAAWLLTKGTLPMTRRQTLA
jgi:hypothetical protein